jgi:hypothetical protein
LGTTGNIKGSNWNGSVGNARDDAVSTLAMANALFRPENWDKLRGQVARQNEREKRSHSLDDYKIALSGAMSTAEIKEK